MFVAFSPKLECWKISSKINSNRHFYKHT